MPVNETGRVIIHKGLGNRIIQPGQDYPGREVGSDGNYLPEHTGAPAPGASAGKVEIPARDALEEMTVPKLKELADSCKLQFAGDIRKAELIDLLDAARAAAATGGDQ